MTNILLQAVTDTTNAWVGVVGNLLHSISLPSWVGPAVAILLGIGAAVQLVLKRIPTPSSVKIGGIVGKILDLLTFWEKDIVSK